MLFHEIIESHPGEKAAVIFKDKTINFFELRTKINCWAGILQSQGIKKGDKVGLLSKNCYDFIVAYFAIVKSGGVVVPINFQLSPYEISYIVRNADIKLIVAKENMSIAPVLTGQGLADLRQISFAELDEAPGQEYVPVEMNENDNCTIIYTSGTTGTPKGAMLSHRNLIANVLSYTKIVPMLPTDKALCVLPMYHCFAWTVSVVGPIMNGGCIVVQENYNLTEVVKLIHEYKIDQFAGVPTMILMFLRGADAEYLKSIRFFISGGAPLPQELAKGFMAKFGKPVQEGYGLSEASPVCAVNPADNVKIGSIGPALPFVDIEIRDENDCEVPVGVVGEMCVRGENVMLGYLNMPEETAEALRGGWLHTGDLAYKDEDGYIFVVDRLKDMIILGGENVYPREVEEVLYAMPEVLEASVVGVEDAVRGQAVCAFIVLKEGMQLDAKAARKHLMERLALFKVPRHYFFCEALPKNGTGKIMKTELREQAKNLLNKH